MISTLSIILLLIGSGMNKQYTVKKIITDINDFSQEEYWENINPLEIDSFLWEDNGYKPRVIVKVMYSDKYLYVYFKAFEKKIRIQCTKFGGDVWKDSCVEFFINPFPQKSKKYINIEVNAIGKMLIAMGEDRNNRKTFSEKETKEFEIKSSVTKAIDGYHGNDYWTIHYKIPLAFFEKYYNEKFRSGKVAGNFYKCGDETEYAHYGVWNNIESETPDFHVPQFFGDIIFE